MLKIFRFEISLLRFILILTSVQMLSVDTSLMSPVGGGGSAPASLFASIPSTHEGRMEMIKMLVEQVCAC